MIRYLQRVLTKDLAIDLGTAHTSVYIKNEGVVLREPSVVAVDQASGKVLAIGAAAKRMVGRTPHSILAVRPIRDGVIANFSVTKEMIRYFIRKAYHRHAFVHPRVVVAVPSAITAVERRAVRESAEAAGVREVYMIEEVMAAAIGADLSVEEPKGKLIVDLGGGTSEAALISLGGIVVSRTSDSAGDEMDEAISQYFRRKHNLIVGETTSEWVKMEIGSVFAMPAETTLEVRGRDQVLGRPRTVVVGAEDIRQVLLEPAQRVIEMVRQVLESAPAQLAADLVDRGIVLSGGGSLLRGFAELLQEATHLPVVRAADPLNCVAIGAGKFLEEVDHVRPSLGRVPHYRFRTA